MRFILPLFAAAMIIAAPAHAEPKHYTLEKPHTQIFFTVNHLGFSNSTGQFIDYNGAIDFDQAAPESSKVEATIKTASLTMANQKWDDHLKGADFFNVEKFPDITFKSTGVKKTGADTADITGDLTILGVTKPVVLATKLNKVGAHPMSGNDHVGFSATTTFKRSDFGMKYGLPNVGDDVTVRIEVEGEGAAGASAK
jgi:polyisoprenoid-binding protein YceI